MVEHTFVERAIHFIDRSGSQALQGWWMILLVVVVWVGLFALLILMLKSVSYRIGLKHLKITVLGIPVRRVRLDNIRNIHTRGPRLAERWHNVLLPRADRTLVIEKRRGLVKNLVITPEQRYVFKMELDRAIRARIGLEPGPSVGDVMTFDQMQAKMQAGTGPPAPGSSTRA